MKKLSELANDAELSYEDAGYVYTTHELKRDLLDPEEDDYPLAKDWYLVERKRWTPDAKTMIADYIENEYQSMYEDWDERAMDCVSEEVVSKIQAVLEEAFKGDSVAAYWDQTEEVQIDMENL